MAEVAIDQIRAEVRWEDSDQHIHIEQLNIDGELIEWKAP